MNVEKEIKDLQWQMANHLHTVRTDMRVPTTQTAHYNKPVASQEFNGVTVDKAVADLRNTPVTLPKDQVLVITLPDGKSYVTHEVAQAYYDAIKAGLIDGVFCGNYKELIEELESVTTHGNNLFKQHMDIATRLGVDNKTSAILRAIKELQAKATYPGLAALTEVQIASIIEHELAHYGSSLAAARAIIGRHTRTGVVEFSQFVRRDQHLRTEEYVSTLTDKVTELDKEVQRKRDEITRAVNEANRIAAQRDKALARINALEQQNPDELIVSELEGALANAELCCKNYNEELTLLRQTMEIERQEALELRIRLRKINEIDKSYHTLVEERNRLLDQIKGERESRESIIKILNDERKDFREREDKDSARQLKLIAALSDVESLKQENASLREKLRERSE